MLGLLCDRGRLRGIWHWRERWMRIQVVVDDFRVCAASIRSSGRMSNSVGYELSAGYSGCTRLVILTPYMAVNQLRNFVEQNGLQVHTPQSAFDRSRAMGDDLYYLLHEALVGRNFAIPAMH